jgi:hypothetical protein
VLQSFWEAKLLDWRLWPTLKLLAVLVLVIASAVLTNTVRSRRDKKRFMGALAQQSRQLEQTQSQLQDTKHRLAAAEKKLGFLNQHKTKVQVTAFTVQGTFANGIKTAHSYAVPTHRLPENNVLNIALSPTARERLHARFNDYIVLLDRYQQKMRLARFVDTTSADELRPVVDVFFGNPDEARIFGRQNFQAVNISADGSPFSETE